MAGQIDNRDGLEPRGVVEATDLDGLQDDLGIPAGGFTVYKGGLQRLRQSEREQNRAALGLPASKPMGRRR